MKRKRIGSSFESFLAEEEILEDCRAAAIKFKITYIALLRAVNVGGTGKLAMTDLVALCKKARFANPRTYIASGNVLFESSLPEARVKATLEKALEAFTGKPAQVLVRTAAEMAAVHAGNPFSGKAPNRTLAIFLDAPPPPDTHQHITGKADEDVRLGLREIYVHYGEGMAQSKLKIPAARNGTARNMNTIYKLIQLMKPSP